MIESNNENQNPEFKELAPDLSTPWPVPDLSAFAPDLDAMMQAGKESEARVIEAGKIPFDFAAVEAAGKASEARAFAALTANVDESPQKKTAAPAENISALHQTLAEFVATLPATIQQNGKADHAHLWGIAKKNAQIARNVETRADELATLFAQVKEQGFTPADLVAIERHWRGVPIFGYGTPDYVLPPGYCRADLEGEAE